MGKIKPQKDNSKSKNIRRKERNDCRKNKESKKETKGKGDLNKEVKKLLLFAAGLNILTRLVYGSFWNNKVKNRNLISLVACVRNITWGWDDQYTNIKNIINFCLFLIYPIVLWKNLIFHKNNLRAEN